MEVILLERIEKLGQMGDVVTVKPGYARNYLLPQRKALRATEGNRSYFEGQRGQLEAENLERRKEAEAVGGKLDRSEEHTSELQSLMRISYAVFCLKKKKKTR